MYVSIGSLPPSLDPINMGSKTVNRQLFESLHTITGVPGTLYHKTSNTPSKVRFCMSITFDFQGPLTIPSPLHSGCCWRCKEIQVLCFISRLYSVSDVSLPLNKAVLPFLRESIKNKSRVYPMKDFDTLNTYIISVNKGTCDECKYNIRPSFLD